MKTFKEILTAAPAEFEASPVLPAGVYQVVVKKAEVAQLAFDFGESRKQGDDVLNIYMSPTAAAEVDPDDLAECENWRDTLLSIRIFPDEIGDKFVDAKNQRGFVYHCGLDPNDYENLEALILACNGKHLLGTVKHAPNKKDPDRPFVNVSATAPL